MASQEIKLVRIQETELLSPETGLSRQVSAYNEKLMSVRNLMERGWIGARHSHPHEQLVYVIRGHIQFTGGEATFNARTGDSFVVPGGVEHQAPGLGRVRGAGRILSVSRGLCAGFGERKCLIPFSSRAAYWPKFGCEFHPRPLPHGANRPSF